MPDYESPSLADVIATARPPRTVDPERWAEAILEVRAYLIDRIIESEIPDITYGELSKQVAQDVMRNRGGRGLDWLKTRTLLGDVSTIEHEHDRPMLTVLVVSQKDGNPGGGFFGLGDILGRHVGVEGQFLREEHQRVIDYWKAQA